MEQNPTIEEILKFIEEGEKTMQSKYGQKNAVLVLGNPASDKTIFIKWITHNDATLVSKKSTVNSVEYTIEDNASDKPSSPADTVFPELFMNKNTNPNTAFYDLPDSRFNRGINQNIATTYFIKKVIQNVENVKMIFFLNYAELKSGKFESNIKNLMTTTIPMVRNFDKFKDSVILLVSNVDVDQAKFSYDEIISSVVSSIEDARDELQNETDEKNVDNSRSIQFLNTILGKNSDDNSHIQLFWSPTKDGPLSEIPLMEQNRGNISAAIDKLSYSPKNDTYFDYFVPKNSLFHIDVLLNEVHQQILNGIKNFGQQVQMHLYNEENQFYDILQLFKETASSFDKLTALKNMANQQLEPEKCVQVITREANLANNSGTSEGLMNITKYVNYSSFLYSVRCYLTNESFKCGDGLNDIIEYSEKSRDWYQFLINLYANRLSTYDVQKNSTESSCNELAKFVIEGGMKNVNQSSDILEPYVKACDPDGEYKFKATIMDEHKFNALKSLLDLIMNHQMDYTYDSNRLLIKGQYVKFSDIVKHEENSNQSREFIQIFAAQKLFIDRDLEQMGEIQLSVIAHTWDVQGVQKIVLRGEPGKPYELSKADNGNEEDRHGKEGNPGLPGEPGGHFFGTGHFFMGFQALTTSSVGGQGGSGQNGGDGAPGKNGADATNDLNITEKYPKKSPGHKILEARALNGTCEGSIPCILEEVYTLQGQEGEPGGNGGDGGVGGEGGPPGTVTFVHTSNGIGVKFTHETVHGSKGLSGDGGVGGVGGMYGRNGVVVVRHPSNGNDTSWLSQMNFTLQDEGTEESASNGLSGLPDKNNHSIQNPRESGSLANQRKIVDEYKTYLRENMYRSVRESHLQAFHDVITDTPPLTTTSTTTTTSNPDSPPVSIHTTSTPSPTFSQTISSEASSSQTISSQTISSQTTPSQTPPPSSTATGSPNTTTTPYNAAHNLNSPINNVINAILNFFVPLKFIYPAFVSNDKFIENRIESTSSQSSSFFINTKPHEFGINGAILLADFFIRYVTKVKHHNNANKTTDIFEIRSITLVIIAEFETILTRMIEKSNLRSDFDPVSLISKLDEKLINRDYRNLAKTLFQSVDENAHLNYTTFEKDMQPKLQQILKSRS